MIKRLNGDKCWSKKSNLKSFHLSHTKIDFLLIYYCPYSLLQYLHLCESANQWTKYCSFNIVHTHKLSVFSIKIKWENRHNINGIYVGLISDLHASENKKKKEKKMGKLGRSTLQMVAKIVVPKSMAFTLSCRAKKT